MQVRSNSLTLNVGVHGSGDPLLFLGGSGWDMRVHGEKIFPHLSPCFETCFYDQRGTGQSDKPKGPYTIRDYAQDALGLLDQLGWDQAHIVGYSFGGMVAQELAIGWPTRISTLVLAATSPGGALGSSYPIETFMDLDPMMRAKRSLEVSDIRFSRAYQEKNPQEAGMRIEKKMQEQQRFLWEEGAADGFANLLEARKHHDAGERLHLIKASTLILSGAHDGQASDAGQKAMAERIANATRKMVTGGHNFIFENADGFDAITAFCARQKDRD